MAKFLATCIFLFGILITPAMAQTTEQEADELAALRYYADVIGSLESIKFITSSARDNIRPSDWVQSELEVDGSGRLLREAAKALRLSAKAADLQNAPWLRRWEQANNATGIVRKIAAAINLTAEFVDSVQRNQTSTAEEKLNSMAEIIRDINTLAPANTPVSLYVGILADAVEAIAHDAAIIESATKQKNDTIEMVNRLLVGEDYAEPSADSFPTVISTIEARIEEIERQAARRAFGAAYQKIVDAENGCALASNTTRDNISKLRQQLATAHREIRNITVAKNTDMAIVASLQALINTTNEGLAEARVAQLGADITKVVAARDRAARYEHELQLYQSELDRTRLSATERTQIHDARARVVQQKIADLQSVLTTFNNCVRDRLGASDIDLAEIIDTYFPQYKNAANDSSSAAESEPAGSGFAVRVVELKIGNPAPRDGGFAQEGVLGAPDWQDDDTQPTYTTLGCGGVLVVQFAGAGAVNRDGPDIAVYEIGSNSEAYRVEISANQTNWFLLGQSGGGTGKFDIANAPAPNDGNYPFVRITDLQERCDGGFAGADIDAVEAIHASQSE